jgi:hypothetical protein
MTLDKKLLTYPIRIFCAFEHSFEAVILFWRKKIVINIIQINQAKNTKEKKPLMTCIKIKENKKDKIAG